jgi:hypothetical protein
MVLESEERESSVFLQHPPCLSFGTFLFHAFLTNLEETVEPTAVALKLPRADLISNPKSLAGLLVKVYESMHLRHS